MALVSPNAPHPEIISNPDQPMEDDETSTPHVSSFDCRRIYGAVVMGPLTQSPGLCDVESPFIVCQPCPV